MVGRVAAVLRAVSASMPAGLGTTSIAQATGLSRPTVHRILNSLADDGFVDHDADDRALVSRPRAVSHGSDRRGAIRHHRCRPRQRARLGRDDRRERVPLGTARRRDACACCARRGRSRSARSCSTRACGFRSEWPAAGLAILAFLPDAQVDDYLASTDLTADFGDAHAPDAVRARVVATRERGYARQPRAASSRAAGAWAAAVFDSGRATRRGRSASPAWSRGSAAPGSPNSGDCCSTTRTGSRGLLRRRKGPRPRYRASSQTCRVPWPPGSASSTPPGPTKSVTGTVATTAGVTPSSTT